eukprot:scaffold4461_cov263-Pinguiococcus_pyrenoidosus.AAC.5
MSPSSCLLPFHIEPPTPMERHTKETLFTSIKSKRKDPCKTIFWLSPAQLPGWCLGATSHNRNHPGGLTRPARLDPSSQHAASAPSAQCPSWHPHSPDPMPPPGGSA